MPEVWGRCPGDDEILWELWVSIEVRGNQLSKM